MEYLEQHIISELQKIPENKVTKEIIIPLLESLGFFKVEFYGGTDEQGKDILCWEYNKFDELKLTVAQVKHFKFTNSASDSKSFQTVFNQLIQCFTEHLPFSDQSTHMPEEALLISTYVIDTKTLKSRLASHPSLMTERVKIIDGLKLASLLKKNKPNLVKKLMGIEVDIYSRLELTLNNDILLKSLGYFEKKSIKHIYIDIDFSLGKRTTQLFFDSSFKPTKKTLNFDYNDWMKFKSNCFTIESEFGLNFLSQTFEECEVIFKSLQERLKKKDSKSREKTKTNKIQKIKDEKYTIEVEIEPKYTIGIDGEILANKILEKRKWIEKNAIEYNKHGTSLDNIRTFINRTKNIIDCASILFLKRNRFLSCLIEGELKLIRKNFESTRLKLPLEQIFDTHINFSILGDAGAGKTTCLQMYTIKKRKDKSRLYIYLPLSRVIQAWLKVSELEKEKEKKKNRLEKGIAEYLSNSGVTITLEQFQTLIKTKKITLLLDGIDEAIKIASWLNEEIYRLSNNYKENVQVIVSSRMSGSYLDDIPFFDITLLPFTNKQKVHFVDSWFGPQRKNIATNIKKHFEKNNALNELVSNPLLTTILCVLAENLLPIPNTEIKLYDNRLDLLTGYYDNVKNISRISTLPDNLKILAQKLAFYLHSNSTREENFFELEKISVRLMSNRLRLEATQDALKELIDPCNILVPMTDDGKFGFGHLRFQEHLAAKEIINNRSINITPLLNQGWWRSVLLYFAKMNDDLTWLIHALGRENNIPSSKKNMLISMINVRPANERKDLESLYKEYLNIRGWNDLDDQDYFSLDE